MVLNYMYTDASTAPLQEWVWLELAGVCSCVCVCWCVVMVRANSERLHWLLPGSDVIDDITGNIFWPVTQAKGKRGREAGCFYASGATAENVYFALNGDFKKWWQEKQMKNEDKCRKRVVGQAIYINVSLSVERWMAAISSIGNKSRSASIIEPEFCDEWIKIAMIFKKELFSQKLTANETSPSPAAPGLHQTSVSD